MKDIGFLEYVDLDIADVHFYNNTCDTTGGLHGIWFRGNKGIASCEFKNNIIYGTGTMYGVMEIAALIDGTPESPGKNNLLFKPNKIITGFFNDYRLRVGSPAIDAGFNMLQ